MAEIAAGLSGRIAAEAAGSGEGNIPDAPLLSSIVAANSILTEMVALKLAATTASEPRAAVSEMLRGSNIRRENEEISRAIVRA